MAGAAAGVATDNATQAKRVYFVIAPISPTGGGGFLGSGLPPPLRDDLTSAERVSGEPSTATIHTGAGVSRASSGGGPSNV